MDEMQQQGQQASSSYDCGEETTWVPKIDMVFENDEQAYHFYCHYGRRMGFGVRKHLVKRRSSGLVYCRVFSCYKEGFCRSLKEGKKQRLDGRTGCQAHITIRILDDGRFRVSDFEPKHNHELVPGSPILDGTNDSRPTISTGDKHAIQHAHMNFPPMKHVGSANAGNSEAVLKHAQTRVLGTISYRPLTAEGQPMLDTPSENLLPKLGMEFEDDNEAYQFYVNYAIGIGFSVRKHLVKRRSSGVVYSRTYVCHKEGFRRKKDEQQCRCPKPYDRTGCLASMTIKITKSGRYHITEFEPKHNHALVIPSKAHMFRWRWRRGILATQTDVSGLSDDMMEMAEACKDQMTGEIENYESLGYNNCIPSKQITGKKVGDIGAMMQYFQEKQVSDPSFFYALHLDHKDQITNAFWTDARSVINFECFDDVLCFDTSYKMNAHGWPFTPFVGVNHHRQAIIFGAAILYDETEESLKWLFETFKHAMNGKQPNVILTGKSTEMSNAVASVWPSTTHQLSTWHIYNDAVTHLNFIFQGSTTFAKDFSKCLFDYEDEEEFSMAWRTFIEYYDLHNNEWLCKIYEDRKTWALAYGRQTFCADMSTILFRESMTKRIKQNLDTEIDLLNFFKNYDDIINEQRDLELQADMHAHQHIVKMPFSRMLRQAINAYTPAVYMVFQTEFELSMDCMVNSFGQAESVFKYKVSVEDKPKEYIVSFDSSNGTIKCNCRKFESSGIQCRHVLKTLDVLNIKELPPQYILKRWTKDAKVTSISASHAINLDNRLVIPRCYKSLCCIFNKIATRAAEHVESYTFMESLSDQFMNQICRILRSGNPTNPETV